MTTVLLTGVTGFLGIHILRDLLLNEKVKKNRLYNKKQNKCKRKKETRKNDGILL